jgi:uncharacterized phage-associated protein
MQLIKLANIILFFSWNCKDLGLTKLNKLLYYLDVFSLKETGRTATGQDYKKYPQGPVPEVYNRLKELLDKSEAIGYHDIFEDFFEINPQKYYNNILYQITPKREFDPKYVSDFELKLMKDVVEEYGQLTAKQLSYKTHKENPWKLAEDFEPIDLKLFFKDTLSKKEYSVLEEEERLSSAIDLNYA